jgi:hypothetical protein
LIKYYPLVAVWTFVLGYDEAFRGQMFETVLAGVVAAVVAAIAIEYATTTVTAVIHRMTYFSGGFLPALYRRAVDELKPNISVVLQSGLDFAAGTLN